MIDQTTLGHRYLLQQFNVTPKVTWQIDPFGHTAVQESLLSSGLSGFSALFFGRADYADIANRENSSVLGMEMIWQASPSLGAQAAAFTGINFNLYQPPPGACA
jgi:alpha-mannosidase